MASPAPQDPEVRAIVPLLATAGCASGISQRVMDPLLPSLADEFTAPLAAVAWVITAFSLGYAVSQLLFGPLGDRHGKLRVITAVCGANAAAAVACALAPGLGSLVAARVLAGIACAGLIPLAMAWIGDAVPYERRQPVISRFAIGQILGVALGQLLGGLASDHDARAAPFVLLALMFTVSTVLLARQRHALESEARNVALAKASAGAHTAGQLLREFVLVLREPWARVVLLAVFLEGAFVLGAFAFFATHLHRALGVSLTAAGGASMLFGLGGLVFSLTARRWIGRWGESGLVRRGGVLVLAMMGVVALAPGIVIVGLACFVMGIAFYMVHSTLQTNATQMVPARRGAAVAAFAQLYFVGQAAGVGGVGWALGHFDAPGVILACAGCMLLTTLYFAARRAGHVAAKG